ncbi:unnamed protein product [Soboliphyme baturini]|uniref:Ig domain-containing protein n=1 Tax=Soboliphyme baturini TaxID=241478 RepID=A0A183IK74_9BILA|nr:unnamed protein product [Soboliphyme baturini]
MLTQPDGIIELKILNTTAWDSGCYRCVVENEFGSDRTVADVSVSKAPLLRRKPNLLLKKKSQKTKNQDSVMDYMT